MLLRKCWSYTSGIAKMTVQSLQIINEFNKLQPYTYIDSIQKYLRVMDVLNMRERAIGTFTVD